MLNRLSGLADETSSFFYRLKKIEVENTKNAASNCSNSMQKMEEADGKNLKVEGVAQTVPHISEPMNTPNDCLKSVLNE